MKCKYCNGTGKTYLISVSKYDVCAWCAAGSREDEEEEEEK